MTTIEEDRRPVTVQEAIAALGRLEADAAIGRAVRAYVDEWRFTHDEVTAALGRLGPTNGRDEGIVKIAAQTAVAIAALGDDR